MTFIYLNSYTYVMAKSLLFVNKTKLLLRPLYISMTSIGFYDTCFACVQKLGRGRGFIIENEYWIFLVYFQFFHYSILFSGVCFLWPWYNKVIIKPFCRKSFISKVIEIKQRGIAQQQIKYPLKVPTKIKKKRNEYIDHYLWH